MTTRLISNKPDFYCFTLSSAISLGSGSEVHTVLASPRAEAAGDVLVPGKFT